jgi:hypothetical protein
MRFPVMEVNSVPPSPVPRAPIIYKMLWRTGNICLLRHAAVRLSKLVTVVRAFGERTHAQGRLTSRLWNAGSALEEPAWL